MLNFSDCTLAGLEDTFGLAQVEELPALREWLAGTAEMSEFERESLLTFQERLHTSGSDWNGTALA